MYNYPQRFIWLVVYKYNKGYPTFAKALHTRLSARREVKRMKICRKNAQAEIRKLPLPNWE